MSMYYKGMSAGGGASVREERIRANGGDFTEREFQGMLAWQRYRCYNPFCKIDLRGGGVEIHRDHLIPVALGGTSNISNIRALCGPCNLRKHAKPWNVFLSEEAQRSLHNGDHFGGEGEAAPGTPAGRAMGAGADGGAVGEDPWLLEFLVGAVKGAVVVIALFLFLVLMVGAASAKKNKGLKMGAAAIGGGAGAGWLGAWVSQGMNGARFAGFIVGFLGMAFGVLALGSGGSSDAGTSSSGATPPAVAAREATYAQPVVRAPPGYWSHPSVGTASIGSSSGQVETGGASSVHVIVQEQPVQVARTPLQEKVAQATMRAAGVNGRRNIGCGWWPVGSDADRDCANGHFIGR
jgi:hypothetical protein